jgi:hypothetical protein
MSFTYDPTTDLGKVRLLIPDTDSTNPIFTDAEITAFFQIQQMQFQSSMFFSPPGGRNLPSSPVSLLRVAALAIGVIAGNQAKLSQITQILDVHLSPDKAAQQLREQAREYRCIDDEAGAFAIIEQCATGWAFSDRWWNQIQRQSGGGF